ncbi:MAG: GAF domain-containing sensor histidine kinase [Holophagaceae bacterium]|uniref:histidine kinase n=1 Tax=Candidatus Geothrix skivensis TaxID=2954439 RepID=A0A9D7SHJ6_9BACT|nr:GAF domain-containing sensor histidine kinase [Candidatus Geothrix skivensis]
MVESNPTLQFLPARPEEPEPFPPEEQAILDHVNQKIAAALSLDRLMDFLFDAIRNLCPCDRLGLAFLEDEGRRVAAHWTRALYEPVHLKQGYSEDLSQSSLQRVLDSGSPRLIHDLAMYLQEHPRSAATALLVKEGVRSSMTCALTVEGRSVGLVFLSSRNPHSYTAHHVRLWQALAERLSQAVEKAWRIEQLQASNQAFSEMLGFVSHELKNPVASMITDARVLAMGYLGPLDPRQVAKLDNLMRKGEYLLDLVRDYLDLARMEGGELIPSPRRMDLVAEVLEPALELVLPMFEENQQHLERDYPSGSMEVEADPALLRIVVTNLLGNAAKYGRPGGLIRLKARQDAEGFLVSSFNEGPGWAPEERTRLFRRFSRLQAPELRAKKGTGLGLYTAWRIVRLHGGRLEADSEQGRWAEFTLVIPQPS